MGGRKYLAPGRWVLLQDEGLDTFILSWNCWTIFWIATVLGFFELARAGDLTGWLFSRKLLLGTMYILII